MELGHPGSFGSVTAPSGPVVPSPIYAEIGQLQNEVARLHDAIDKLGNRLEPALRAAPPSNAAIAKEGAPTAPILAEEIAAQRRGVSDAANRLFELLDRIAL